MTTCGACTTSCPRRGELGIFNRSHCEDVAVARDAGGPSVVRDAVVAQLLVSTFRTMDPKVPAADPDLDDVVIT